MAIKILQKEVNIRLAHELFRERLQYDEREKYHVKMRFPNSQPSETDVEDVAWVKEYGFWMYISQDPWEWNVFGLSEEDPFAWEAETIICRIGFRPKQGGAIGRDEFGGILVLHSGDLNGGPVGFDKPSFWQHYQGPYIESGEARDRFAVVTHLGALTVAKQVGEFLNEIARIQKQILGAR
jgi:hypothetical protein